MFLLKYLWYVVQHKWFVMLECFKEGLYWQGIIHDLSKFSPAEFFSYALRFFYKTEDQERLEKIRNAFFYAWLHHLHHNKHHWDHWILEGKPLKMPKKYVIEMICDWRAMGRSLGIQLSNIT